MKRLNVNSVLWLIYGGLLAVLLPHTAWAFSKFEPPTAWGHATAWAAAFTFELAVAALTKKLAARMESTPRYSAGRVVLRRLAWRYGNSYFVGLLAATAVSSLANLAHAVEFGGDLAVFARWRVPFGVYALAFGGILPLVSILFASVLSNVADGEREADEDLLKAKEELRQVRSELRAANARANEAERKTAATELRFAQAAPLFGGDKREAILAARALWPDAAQRTWAEVAGASPGYVSEVVSGNGHEGAATREVAERGEGKYSNAR